MSLLLCRSQSPWGCNPLKKRETVPNTHCYHYVAATCAVVWHSFCLRQQLLSKSQLYIHIPSYYSLTPPPFFIDIWIAANNAIPLRVPLKETM